MIDWSWLVIGLASLLTGIVNLPVALKELRNTCRGLIFFEPQKSLGFWLWLAVQLLFPSVIFLIWVTNLFTTKPAIDFALFFKAIGAGAGFVAFLNARMDAEFFKLDIKSLYSELVRVGYRIIATEETDRTRKFLVALDQELRQNQADLAQGLRSLKFYFEADITSEEKEKLITTIDQALSESREKQIEAILTLVKAIRRRDLVSILQEFGCSESLLMQYFPKRIEAAKRAMLPPS